MSPQKSSVSSPSKKQRFNSQYDQWTHWMNSLPTPKNSKKRKFPPLQKRFTQDNITFFDQ